MLLILPLLLFCGGRKPAPAPAELPDWNRSIVNSQSELPGMDAVVDSFMRFWALKGVSIAVTRHDSLIYARGYGKADPSTPMTPGTIMRLASVSKLLTAIGVMRLQEQGKIFLETPVFGPYGILNEYDTSIRDDNYYLMTVEHLLRHQGGFHYRGADVMFTGYHPDTGEFVREELRRPLAFTPGTWQQYSNFGYLLLSLVIEKASGMSYEEFMQKEVFEPCGCRGFRIAGNYLKDRLPGEPVDDDLDRLQLEALKCFLSAGKPVFGICRGHQLLNVALGGTLILHLSGAENHMHLSAGEDNTHRVVSEAHSFVHRIYGGTCTVNSSHHQGVELPGEGLQVVMRSADGVVEAMAHSTLPVWSVQWHPERMCFRHRRNDTVDGSLVIRFFLDQCLSRR